MLNNHSLTKHKLDGKLLMTVGLCLMTLVLPFTAYAQSGVGSIDTSRVDDVVTFTITDAELDGHQGDYDFVVYCSDWTEVTDSRLADPATLIHTASYANIVADCPSEDTIQFAFENVTFEYNGVIDDVYYQIAYADWSTDTGQSGELDETAVGSLVDELIDSLGTQLETNLPAILTFVAGLIFLLLGIRLIKRQVR